MTDQISSLDETLAVLQADREARKFDGERFQAAVLQHAGEIPSWEIAKCWRYQEWPDRTTIGVPLPPQDAGIDLVAVKHDGSRIAIQCKARSGGGSVTTKQVQQFAGAAPASVFAERWFVAEAHRSTATEDARGRRGGDVRRLRGGAGRRRWRMRGRRQRPNPTRVRPCSKRPWPRA